MVSSIKLRAPISVTGGDVEKALFEQAKEEPSVARAYEQLTGVPAQRAADQLNQALNVDAFDVLSRGWAEVPAVRNAVQLSALVPGPPSIVRLEQHTMTSNSTLVLESQLEDAALPPLRIALQLISGVQSATLAVKDGRIELVALGKASIIARLVYKKFLVKEHSTGFEGAARDPFKRQPAAVGRRADVDIPI
ncbi:MAG TPA: hypothetical protein VNA44_05515 [Burkholderiaceae bacterium]|nr:hypothetical protein [Burkholderiaceae bacterium]